MKLNKNHRSRVVMIILATFQKIHKVSKCTKTCNKNTFPSYLYPFQWSIRSWFMNASIKLVTRAPSTRKRDLIAPTVSKMTPKMISKVTPQILQAKLSSFTSRRARAKRAFRHPFHAPSRQTGQCKMVNATSAKMRKMWKRKWETCKKHIIHACVN